MKYVIFDKHRESFVVKYINSDNSVTLTNNEKEAMLFQSQAEAVAAIETFGTMEFWGTRPSRPHGK